MTHTRSEPAWYLIQCKPRQDERAEENLKNQNVICYRPLVDMEKRKAGRVVHTQESLFPGYLFVHLRLEDNWGPLRSTRGVSRVVSFNREQLPRPVDAGLIQHLQARTAPTPQTLFAQGESVLIQEGCFSEVEALFQGMDGEQRVILLLNILGRQQLVRLPVTAVKSLAK